jgi:uncharacterized membrane protein YbhN (UPF0104 family)
VKDATPLGQTHLSPGVREGERRKRWYAHLLAIPTPVIFVAAAAVATFFLWRQGALTDIGGSLRQVHPAAIAAILLVYAGSILLLALRWHVLVRMSEGVRAWTASAEVFLTSVVVNYAAPIGLAVPTRAALTVRDLGLTPARSGAVVAWEVGLDVAALAVIALGWLALGGTALLQTMTIDSRMVLAGVVLIVVSVAAAAAVARSQRVRSRVGGSPRHLLTRPLQKPGLALLALLLTAGFWGAQLGVMAALLTLFGVSPTLSLLTGVMGLPVLIGMLSPVPGGAGVREALMAGAAQLEGVPAGPVVLAAVAYRLALFVVTPVVWGVVRLVGKRTLSETLHLQPRSRGFRGVSQRSLAAGAARASIEDGKTAVKSNVVSAPPDAKDIRLHHGKRPEGR